MNSILSLLIFALVFLIMDVSDAKTITLEEWKSLEKEEQGVILAESFYNYENFDEFEFDEETIPIPYKNTYQIAKRNAQQVVDNLEFEDMHARVGPGKPSFITIYKLEGEFVGMNIGYSFEGCDMPDNSSPYFNDEKTALAAGCEFSDVSWSWTGSFDASGDLIYDPGYPEWTGY